MSVTSWKQRSRGRPVLLWAVAVIVVVVLFVALWVTVRALMARDQLLGAVPLAHSVSSAAMSGNGDDVAAVIAELQDRAAAAASLTSDPVWRSAEIVPLVGENLTAFRQAAAMIHDVADDALPPLGELASTFTVDSLTPKDGAFDLQVFVNAGPMLAVAHSALDAADVQAQAIDTSGTISQIGEAVDQLVDLVDTSKDIVGGLDTAAALLPPMLGAEGARSYLLLSFNNAELRATGGIPGALAVVTADNGRVSLGDLSTAASLGYFPSPVLPLTDAERALYRDNLGQYMQDVNFTPDFARTGELAQEMWQQRTGDTVDGVLAVDPVALGYILKATGPIDGGSGVTLTAENAAQILLSQAYAMFDEPVEQDLFFAGVTGRIFAAITGGAADNTELIGALARSGNEHRIHVWSAHSAEQALLDGSTIAGGLPESTAAQAAFGVYFNDATAAKMDYYVTAAIDVSAGVCRADERPQYEVTVALTSAAPADAATSLPAYVTGASNQGVIPGIVDTAIYVYAPKNALAYSVTIDGKEHAFVSSEHEGRSVAGIVVKLTPGQTAEARFAFLGDAGTPTAVSVQHTPMASFVELSTNNYLDCTPTRP